MGFDARFLSWRGLGPLGAVVTDGTVRLSTKYDLMASEASDAVGGESVLGMNQT